MRRRPVELGRYLPDFWLPTLGIWLEVEGLDTNIQTSNLWLRCSTGAAQPPGVDPHLWIPTSRRLTCGSGAAFARCRGCSGSGANGAEKAPRMRLLPHRPGFRMMWTRPSSQREATSGVDPRPLRPFTCPAVGKRDRLCGLSAELPSEGLRAALVEAHDLTSGAWRHLMGGWGNGST